MEVILKDGESQKTLLSNFRAGLVETDRDWSPPGERLVRLEIEFKRTQETGTAETIMRDFIRSRPLGVPPVFRSVNEDFINGAISFVQTKWFREEGGKVVVPFAFFSRFYRDAAAAFHGDPVHFCFPMPEFTERGPGIGARIRNIFGKFFHDRGA